MAEYEPNDSRNVTLNPHRAPGEPPRTGPREGETRGERPQQTEFEQDERGEEAESVADQTDAADAEAEAALRERAMERDADELEGPERFDRND
jgi:hypothetical protein